MPLSDSIHTISESAFISHYTQNSPHLMWFLGAGTSRSAGLPTATDLIWDLKRRHYCLHENQNLQSHDINNQAIKHKIQAYMDSKGYPTSESPGEYSFYFDLVFGTDTQAQQQYICSALANDRISLNLGHRVLAGLMGMGKARIVFTTNFDEVIETAYAEVVGKSLATFHLEGSYAALNALNTESFPLYAKIHGDFRYQSIKNLAKDLLGNDQEIQKCFLAAATRYGMVVSGYSGRDRNVLSMLREAASQNNAFPHGLFWTVPSISNVSKGAYEFTAFAREKGVNACLVETGTFDELLSRIWRHTDNKPSELDEKVKTGRVKRVSVPLPAFGKQFPILRTNALPILATPSRCGAVEFNDSLTYGELKDKIGECRPKAVFTLADRMLFWGDSKEVAKVLPADKPYTVALYDLKDGVKLVSELGYMKSFFEEALAVALCRGKPLSLRRYRRSYFATVRDDSADHELFKPLRELIGENGHPGPITGVIPLLSDVMWAECVSIRLEERGGALWAMIRPDIWIKPLSRRQEARDFIRRRCLYRYNKKAYRLLDVWIGLLLGEIGTGNAVKVSCFYGTDYCAEFEIGTRTAYSRGGGSAD